MFFCKKKCKNERIFQPNIELLYTRGMSCHVWYQGLIPGKEYTLNGKAHIWNGRRSSEIRTSMTFKPKMEHGSVLFPFCKGDYASCGKLDISKIHMTLSDNAQIIATVEPGHNPESAEERMLLKMAEREYREVRLQILRFALVPFIVLLVYVAARMIKDLPN